MLHNAQIVGFAEGSHVLMADGSWKTIENVKQGDMVMSFNPAQANSDLEPRKVTNTWSGLHRECLEVHHNNKVTVAAKDQLFFTPGASWAYCFETKQVVDFDGSTLPIQTRNVRGGKWKIYDITVDETHAFIVNDMRVHNKKKKPAPQPVVTAGKPGVPLTVTTTTTKGKTTTTTTVTVQPSPGSSAQISVSGNGAIGIRQNSVPGLPVDGNYVYYQPGMILPYPGGSYVYDRAVNSEIIRAAVCGDILSKGSNYRVTKGDAATWGEELQSLISELQAMKANRIPKNGVNKISIKADPTAINDAIQQAKALKKELQAGRKVTVGHVQQNCNILANIIERIKNSTGLYRLGGGGPVYLPIGYVTGPTPEPMPMPIVSGSSTGDSTPVEPTPDAYFTDRIYESNANYAYIGKLSDNASGPCQFIFDPPDGPANTSVRYYKHWDAATNSYYYDRVSNGGTC